MKRVREYDSARDGLYRLVAELQDGPRVVGSRSTALPNNYSATPAPGEPTGGGGSGAKSRFTSIYVRDLDSVTDALFLATAAVGTSFTVGLPGATADLVLTYATGPVRLGWPADLSAGEIELDLQLFGIGSILWLPGGNPWCCENNTANDPETVLLVTKPAGIQLQESDGLTVGRIILKIKGPLTA